jgi:hypothetical protein
MWAAFRPSAAFHAPPSRGEHGIAERQKGINPEIGTALALLGLDLHAGISESSSVPRKTRLDAHP